MAGDESTWTCALCEKSMPSWAMHYCQRERHRAEPGMRRSTMVVIAGPTFHANTALERAKAVVICAAYVSANTMIEQGDALRLAQSIADAACAAGGDHGG